MTISSVSYAATTGSLTISGTIPAATSITVNPSVGYSSLDLVNGETNKVVAVVTEKNNTLLGYSVTLASSNSGLLKNGTLGSINYTAKYNNVIVTLSSTPQTITTQGSQVAIVNSNKNFAVTTTPTPEDMIVEGVYTDTLLFTISSN